MRRVDRIPRLFGAAGGIIQQLHDPGSGAIGRGLRFRASRLEFSTYAAFATRADLGRFTSGGAHGEIFRALRRRLGRLEAAKVELTGAELPRDWREIDAIIDESLRSRGSGSPPPA